MKEFAGLNNLKKNNFYRINDIPKNNNKSNKPNSKKKSYNKFPNYNNKTYKEINNEKELIDNYKKIDENKNNYKIDYKENNIKEIDKEKEIIVNSKKMNDNKNNNNPISLNNINISDNNNINKNQGIKIKENNIRIKSKCKQNLNINIANNIGNKEKQNTFSENVDNKQTDKKFVNDTENTQKVNHKDSFEKNIGNETPKGNTGNKIFINFKQIIKDKFNLSSTKNNKYTHTIKFNANANNHKLKIPNNYLKRVKAKSNIINPNIIKEIAKNNDNEIDEKNSNIIRINKINNDLDNKIKTNNLTEQINNTNIININRNYNFSPTKLKLNNNKDIDINNNKDNFNKKIPLNKSIGNENISQSDLENDEDNNILKIKNFNEIIRNKLSNKENYTENINKEQTDNNINYAKSFKNKDNIKIITNDIITSKTANMNVNNNKISLNTISTTSRTHNMNPDNNIDNPEKKDEIPTKIQYFKKYKFDSKAGKDAFGKRKINQDVYLAKINMNNIEGFNAFGVLDGHGEYGHKVSSFSRDFIIDEINKNIQQLNLKTLPEIYTELKKDNYSLIKKAYKKVDKELPKQQFNSNFSGTTCIIVFQIGKNLITANVGDSRAILIYSENPDDKKLENTKIIELSIDQKPELPEEKKRIYKMGGIVDQMLDGKGKRNGPFRVWAGKQNYPGLAMSRSIGDLKGKGCGLISEPEIIEYKLNIKSKYMIICSDGVWEFLKNEDVMNIGNSYYINNNIDGCIEEIIKISEFWWQKEDIVRDDITIVAVFF